MPVIASELLLLAVALAPALRAESAPLGPWLERTGQRIERFWDQFSAVAATEAVTQLKLGPENKVLQQRRAVFDYVIPMNLVGDDLSVEESRVQQGKVEKPARQPLLVTSGFSTLLLVFHPHFQSSYEFVKLPDEEANGKRLQRIAFTHVHRARSPSVLQLRGRDYPIEWQGTAWIDPASGRVLRIRTDLKTPMDDVGLKRLTADAAYRARCDGLPREGLRCVSPGPADAGAGSVGLGRRRGCDRALGRDVEPRAADVPPHGGAQRRLAALRRGGRRGPRRVPAAFGAPNQWERRSTVVRFRRSRIRGIHALIRRCP